MVSSCAILFQKLSSLADGPQKTPSEAGRYDLPRSLFIPCSAASYLLIPDAVGVGVKVQNIILPRITTIQEYPDVVGD